MADEQTTQSPDKKKGKKLLLIGLPVILVAVGAAFFLVGGGEETEETSTTLSNAEGDVIEVDTLTVNLVGEEGRYARIGFAVVLVEGADASLVAKKLPLLRDVALTVMTGFSSAELQTASGMERLRQALSDESVALFPDGEVLRAVLTELIVQ